MMAGTASGAAQTELSILRGCCRDKYLSYQTYEQKSSMSTSGSYMAPIIKSTWQSLLCLSLQHPDKRGKNSLCRWSRSAWIDLERGRAKYV